MMKKMIYVAMVAAFASGCAREAKQSASGPAPFHLAVTDSGFTPSSITIPAGTPVTLVVTRTTDQTCAKEIVFPEQGIRKPLPLHEAVEIALPASPKGEIPYVCGMDMIRGTVLVQ